MEEVDAGAGRGGGELLGDGVHGVPEGGDPEAVVGVHPPRRSVILVEDQTPRFVDDEQAVNRRHRLVGRNSSSLPLRFNSISSYHDDLTEGDCKLSL